MPKQWTMRDLLWVMLIVALIAFVARLHYDTFWRPIGPGITIEEDQR